MKNLFVCFLAGWGLYAGCTAGEDIRMLEPLEFVEAARSDGTAVVMDVRRPSEYAEGHLADAVNLDWLDQAAFRKGLEQLDKGRTYYIYCRSGRRSREAATRMRQEGFAVVDMKGGYLRWMEQSER